MKLLQFLLFSIISISVFVSCANNVLKPIEKITPILDTIEVSLGINQIAVWSKSLEGKRVAVVANQTSAFNEVHLVDTLISLGVDLQCVFAPEHGFRGDHDAGASVENGIDKNTGLPIYSLHGNHKKPKKEWLDSLDVIVFDIQDVGVRFYTYISTLHYVMEAAAENDVKLLLLDRPNIHDGYVDGPVLDKQFKSFIGMHPVPVVYGMTIGEYGRMINGEGWLKDSMKCELDVIQVKNYIRGTWDSLEISPSPNLPNIQSIKLYPSLCFFEGTTVSVGRGTDYPFQVYGAPHLENYTFSFIPVSKPGFSKYPKHENVKCNGADFRLENSDTLKEIDWSFLVNAYQQSKAKKSFFLKNNFINLLAGTDSLKAWLKLDYTNQQIKESYQSELDEFKLIRSKYLYYKE